MLYRGAIDDVNYLLTDLYEDCLIIALSFPRYLIKKFNFFKQPSSNRFKLAISEDLSPLGSISDIFIKVIAPEPVTLKGMIVLISEVIVYDHDNIQRRIDNTMKQINIFPLL